MRTVTRLLCAPLLALAAAASAATPTVWQLGTPDGSAAEFKIPYHAWEYGNAPEISKSPAMDFKTHSFNYEIKENKDVPAPELVREIATLAERAWMNNDEIVTGVKLAWNEAAPGMRKLSFGAVDWTNQEKDVNGIEALLPNGGKQLFSLPAGAGKKGEVLKFEALFPVTAGRNELTLRVVSMAKHYRINFDNIALYRMDVTDQEPLLESSVAAVDGVYTLGQEVAVEFKAFNLPDGEGELVYEVSDAFGKIVAGGKVELKGSSGKVSLPTSTRGHFRVDSKLGTASANTAYVVVEPVALEYLDDSRFGCHINADGYRLRTWPEQQESMMRRAFLAGAKWVRHHSIHWFLREPEKGKFDWTHFDERLALAEQYKMRMLVTITGTPLWASSSDNTKMTCCGTYYYQNYPPKKWRDLADFMTALVTRYKGRIQWYELGNEPGYTSAFWCNGSAPDFGMFLKTGYEAAKKADPNCVILSGAPLSPDFLEEAVKSTGGKLYFDVMSIHYLGNADRGGELFKKWKASLTQMGGGDLPCVNTEEMSWKNDGRTLSLAASLQKTYIREAALGLSKTFAFDFFGNGSSFGVSAFDTRGVPLPQYAAYRTLTHRLERSKFVADLSTAEHEAYLFDRQGTAVLAVWSAKDRDLALDLGVGAATLVDIMDVEAPLKAQDGVFKLKIGETPVFVEGGDLALLGAYGELLKTFPQELTAKPGETAERIVNLADSVTNVKLSLPAKWEGSIDKAKLRLVVPKDAEEGVYDAATSLALGGHSFTVPLLINVSVGVPGANLIKNGDFSDETRFWYFPKEKEKWELLKDAGVDGKPALKTKGVAFFGPSSKGIKVRPGERYALFTEAKGSGCFGGVYTLNDKDGKLVFPECQGINCLSRRLEGDWKTYSDVINITQPDAMWLGFAMLANYGDTEGKEALFSNFSIVRLTDRFTVNKALWQGVCAKTSDWSRIPAMSVAGRANVHESDTVKWSSKDDLSASCRMAMDDKFLHLLFTVRDNVSVSAPPDSDLAETWCYDSLQFAFDPTMEGKDRTEILVLRDSAGKAQAYKHVNFWTPELPENITRRGVMPTVKVVAKPVADGMEYQVDIPLAELYPLTKDSKEFGFSWLINDDDGHGRKYIEWSSGIGPNKDSSLFGLVRLAPEQ